MTDSHDDFEAALSQMRPRAMSAELFAQIESRIMRGGSRSAARSWSDRLLLFSMSCGAAAACVIVGLLMLQSARSMPASDSIKAVARQPTAGDYPMAFARANPSRWAQ